MTSKGLSLNLSVMRYHILYKDNEWDLYAKGIWVIESEIMVALNHILVHKTILSIVPESTVIEFTKRAVNTEQLNYQSSILSTNAIPNPEPIVQVSKSNNLFIKIIGLLK